MSKRGGPVAFGPDKAVEGKLTAKSAGAFGKQKDATPHKSDEPAEKQHRQHRAWGYLPRYREGKLEEDHARSSEISRQARQTGEFMHDGPNSAGRQMKGVDPYFIDNCQGRSGQPDNQDVSRGKGRT